MNAKPILISYLRFSRPEQLKGDSVRRQLALGEEWAKKHGMKIADTYRDLGVSAFRGKNAAEGALSRLLRLADDGKVPRGSVLLVEQLDRLSRSAVFEALELFLSIIRRGIKVVTLMDGMEYDRESLSRNVMGLQYSIMQMSLAHEESAKKSDRLAHAWTAKRSRIGEKVLTRRLPAWIKVQGDKLVIDEEKAVVVRRMIKLALDGYGLSTIVKKINSEFDGLARVKYVQRSFVFKILHSRALIGEFQPHRLRYVDGKKVREPVGQPIKDYYPALCDQKTFYAVQRILSSRKRTGGPQGSFTNIFLGMLYHANDGSKIQIQDKGYGRRYCSSAAINGVKGASSYVGFPVDVFERAILMQLQDLILPHLAKDNGADTTKVEIASLEARLAEIDRKVEDTQRLMLSDKAVATASVVGMLAKLDQQRKLLDEQLQVLRGELSARSSVDLSHAHSRLTELVGYFKKGVSTFTEDERVELRNIVRQVIDRIDLRPEHMPGRGYWADVQIKFRDGMTIHDGLTGSDVSVLGFQIFAERVDRMRRDALGHPIKSDASDTPPEFKVSLCEPRFMPVALAAGTPIDHKLDPAKRAVVVAALEKSITKTTPSRRSVPARPARRARR